MTNSRLSNALSPHPAASGLWAWLDQPLRLRELLVVIGGWSVLLAGFFPSIRYAAVPWAVCMAGFAGILWCRRRLGLTPALSRVLLLVYTLKATVALVLFGVSFHRFGLMSSYQMGRGFWTFAVDAITYHTYGLSMLESWRHHAPFNIPLTSIPFQVYCGLVYRVIGPHPLAVILLNSWYDAGTALLVAWMAMRIGSGARAGALAALLAGCWPSTFLWSSTLAKDPLSLFLEAAVISLLLFLGGRIRSRRAGALGARWLLVGTGLLCLSLFLATQLRGYAGHLLSILCWLLAGWLLLEGLVRRAWTQAAHAALLLGCTLLTFFTASWVNPLALISPKSTQLPFVQRYGARDVQQAAAEGQFGEPVPMPERMIRELERRGILEHGQPTSHPRAGHAINAYCMSLIADPLPNVVYGLYNGKCQVVEAYIASTAQPPPEDFFKLPTNPVKFSWTDLQIRRMGFLTSGGTIVGRQIDLETAWDLLRHLPEIVTIPLFYPLSHNWRDFLHGGLNARWYLMEACVLLALTPLLLAGLLWCIRSRRWDGVLVSLVLAAFLIPLGTVVANYGTLFRLRLQFLLPLFVLAALGAHALASARWRLRAFLPGGRG